MFRLDISGNIFELCSSIRLWCLRLFLYKIKDPLRTCHSVLELCYNTGYLIERLCILISIA